MQSLSEVSPLPAAASDAASLALSMHRQAEPALKDLAITEVEPDLKANLCVENKGQAVKQRGRWPLTAAMMSDGSDDDMPQLHVEEQIWAEIFDGRREQLLKYHAEKQPVGDAFRARVFPQQRDSELEPHAKADVGCHIFSKSEESHRHQLKPGRETQATEGGGSATSSYLGQRADTILSSQAGARGDSASSSSHRRPAEMSPSRQKGDSSSCQRPHIETFSFRQCGTEAVAPLHGGARGETTSSSSSAPCNEMTVDVGRQSAGPSSQMLAIEMAASSSASPGRMRPGSVASSIWAPPPNRVFMGTLKSFCAKSGYGFIACIDSYASFGRDVYVKCSKLPDDIKVGVLIAFTIVVNSRGQPRAESVSPRPASVNVFF